MQLLRKFTPWPVHPIITHNGYVRMEKRRPRQWGAYVGTSSMQCLSDLMIITSPNWIHFLFNMYCTLCLVLLHRSGRPTIIRPVWLPQSRQKVCEYYSDSSHAFTHFKFRSAFSGRSTNLLSRSPWPLFALRGGTGGIWLYFFRNPSKFALGGFWKFL